MYLRYEERLHFIQQGEIQLQCPIEGNDVDDNNNKYIFKVGSLQ